MAVIESLEAKLPLNPIIFLGDLNRRARASGNIRQNESSDLLHAWIESSDSFEIHQFNFSTRIISDGFLDIALYKHLARAPQVSFEDTTESDNRGVFIAIHCHGSLRRHFNPPRVRHQMRRINSRLMNLLELKGKCSLAEVPQILKDELFLRLENRRAKSNRFDYRQKCYWLQPSKVLEDCLAENVWTKEIWTPNHVQLTKVRVSTALQV